MKVLILAGGFATRLWPLTENRAKPLLLLDGKTILAHILEKIPKSVETFLLTNKKFEKDFQKELKQLKRQKVEIFCEDAHSDKEKLGALGAVSMVIHHYKIEEDLLVVAGDNLLPELHIDQLCFSSSEAVTAVRQVKEIHEARKFGVVEIKSLRGKRTAREKSKSVLSSRQEVLSFEEKPRHPKSKLVSTGFFGIGEELFLTLHDFAARSPDNLGGVFSEFLKQGKSVFAVEIGGAWFDVGSFDTYLEAHTLLQSKDLLMVNKRDRDQNIFSGKVFVGAGSVVKGCQVIDSIIYPGVRLKNCIISQSVIDEGCDFEGLDLNRKLVRKGTRLHFDDT